ncbi:rhomboid family intramembrane serine protease [Halovenus salina]|uniref:Rhomboid family intramembrane serine protease n=1 Tax=Halovenus salina TaxID=1510225 RepID=A0ABD5W5U5_9EURY|nr:rhomboid family intramembrane serine protease [Halovenus salina]
MVVDVTTLTRVGVAVTALVAVLFGVSLAGRRRVRRVLTDRFLYGVPWGSLVVVVGVFAFYLFAQSGLRHWNEPVVVAFRNWAYPYATGMVTSAFAHASPSHLLGNMLTTILLAPLAEFIWGHYPHERHGIQSPARSLDPRVPETPEPAEFDTSPDEGIPSEDPATQRDDTAQPGVRLRDRPVVRALVIFPGVVLVVSLLTSLYALGWSLGFSGTVFAFLGFVLLRYPVLTAVALLGASLLNTLLNTFLTPVLRATAGSGPPRPPSWAGVNVQAHLLGFLIGVALALGLLWHRDSLPDPARLFGATVLVATVQGLWQLSTADGGTFVRYQGIGIIFVLVLSMLITYIATSENSAATDRVSLAVRGFGVLWLVGSLAVAGGAFALFGTETMIVLSVLAIVPALAVPGALLVVPDGVAGWPVTSRRLLFAALVLVTVVIALPSVAGNSLGMDDNAIPDGDVTVGDYHVSYGEDVTSARTDTTDSGLVVVSERRYVWSATVSDEILAHEGSATVPVGGVGWRETVRAERTGWNVVGNDSVYVVDLETDTERVRSFTSGPSRASVILAGNRVVLVPTDSGFGLTVTRDGEAVGSALIPTPGESVTVDSLTFTTEPHDGTVTLFASTAESRVAIAQKE